jgi:hypothetical protein
MRCQVLTKKMEDEMVIRQLLVQGVKLIHHALHLTTVVTKQLNYELLLRKPELDCDPGWFGLR